MAERSIVSSAGAAVADRSSAMSRIGMLDGEVRSAGELGTKENPEIVPLALRLTSAVTCCQRGLLSEITSSPPFRLELGRDNRGRRAMVRYLRGMLGPLQLLENGLHLRISRVIRILEQHCGVLSGSRRGAHHPPLVHVGHEGALPSEPAQRLGAHRRKAGVGRKRR